jgi:hypothetical protein
MMSSLTQFTITGQATRYWRATFSNPPINLIDPDTILELQQLIGPDFELRLGHHLGHLDSEQS